MSTPETARARVLSALREHFATTDRHLSPDDLAGMTGLELSQVRNALRVLLEANEIIGVTAAEESYPILVTGVVR